MFVVRNASVCLLCLYYISVCLFVCLLASICFVATMQQAHEAEGALGGKSIGDKSVGGCPLHSWPYHHTIQYSTIPYTIPHILYGLEYTGVALITDSITATKLQEQSDEV